MTDYPPPEHLRLGGLPANELPPERPDPVWEWPDDDRPDDPVVARLGADVLLHRWADIQTCPRCGHDYVSPGYLAAHIKRDHADD